MSANTAALSLAEQDVGFQLGMLTNAWRFHRQMAHAGLVSNGDWLSLHERAAAADLTAISGTIRRSTLDDPELLEAVVRDVKHSWRTLAGREDYLADRAAEVAEAFRGRRGHIAFNRLRAWIDDDVARIAEQLRRGLRSHLPKTLRPYFDLGFLFDQGWRRPDAYAFAQQALGSPVLSPYRGGWPPWAPLGALTQELRSIVEHIQQERDGLAEDEDEVEMELITGGESDDAHDGCVALYDVVPGGLAPETDWFTRVNQLCVQSGLESAADRITQLRRACRSALRGEIYREEWLLKLAEFRDELLVELQAQAVGGEKPWASYDRDLWLYQQRKDGISLKALEAKLDTMLPLKPNWGPVSRSQMSEVARKVAAYLGDKEFLKTKRGRPKKPR